MTEDHRKTCLWQHTPSMNRLACQASLYLQLAYLHQKQGFSKCSSVPGQLIFPALGMYIVVHKQQSSKAF